MINSTYQPPQAANSRNNAQQQQQRIVLTNSNAIANRGTTNTTNQLAGTQYGAVTTATTNQFVANQQITEDVEKLEQNITTRLFQYYSLLGVSLLGLIAFLLPIVLVFLCNAQSLHIADAVFLPVKMHLMAFLAFVILGGCIGFVGFSLFGIFAGLLKQTLSEEMKRAISIKQVSGVLRQMNFGIVIAEDAKVYEAKLKLQQATAQCIFWILFFLINVLGGGIALIVYGARQYLAKKLYTLPNERGFELNFNKRFVEPFPRLEASELAFVTGHFRLNTVYPAGTYVNAPGMWILFAEALAVVSVGFVIFSLVKAGYAVGTKSELKKAAASRERAICTAMAQTQQTQNGNHAV